MATVAGLLIIVGYLVAFVGGIMVLIQAFKKSLVWGLCALLVPFAALVFVFMNWKEGKKGFLVSIGGVAVVIVGFVLAVATAEPDPGMGEPPAITEPAPQ